MTKKWGEVAGSDGFKTLPPEQQDQARRQYFDEVVAPQVPQEHVTMAWDAFSTDSGMGRRELPKDVAPSTAGAGRGNGFHGEPPAASGLPIAESVGNTMSTVRDWATGVPLDGEGKGSVLETSRSDDPAFNFKSSSATSRKLQDMEDRVAEHGSIRPIAGPKASVGAVAKGLASDFVVGGKGALAGVDQMIGDATGSEYLLDNARKGRGQADLMSAVNTPEFESETAKGVYGGVSSLVQQIPATAAALLTKNPGLALTGMVAPMVPDSYSKFRQRGASPMTALPAAVATAAAEWVTEKAPMGVLVNKFGKIGAGKFLSEMLAKEIPGEQVATVVQDAIDTATANPDKTWGDYLKERPGAAYQTLVATVTQGGLMAGANAGARAFSGADTSTKTQPTAETIARQKGFLVDQERVKRLRAAGETAVADTLDRRVSGAMADAELEGLQATPYGSDPGFQTRYRQLRTEGVKPAEASARAAMINSFSQIGAQAGLSERAVALASEKAGEMPLDKVPGFLHKFTGGLAKRGLAQPVDLIGQLEATRDDAIEAAMGTVYQPESVQAVDNIDRILNPGQAGDVRAAMDDVMALENANGATDSTQSGPAATGDVTSPDAGAGVADAGSIPVDARRLDTAAAGAPVANGPDAVAAGPGTADAVAVIDAAAHDAATSPRNDLPEPTAAQKAAGNYKVGRINLHGLNISIENPKGSERSGTSPDGTKWSNAMAAHYGYIRGTEGNDGDHVDTFIGPNPESQKVFVVDQVNKDGSFDEHKVLLGAGSIAQADSLYHANYHAGWTGRGAITEMPLDEFKTWVTDGVKTKPIGDLSTSQTNKTPADAGVSTSGPSFTHELRASGTLAVKGDVTAITERLKAAGVTKISPMAGGVMVGKSQASQAQGILNAAQPINQPLGASNGAQAKEAIAPVARPETPAEPVDFTDLPALNADQQQLLDATNAQDMERKFQQDLIAQIKRKRGLTPAQVETEARRSPFKSFIIQHGISDKPSDIVGEGNAFRANQILPTAFRKNGIGMDLLINKAIEAGFITEQDDGAARLTEMIRAEISGEKIHLLQDMQDDAAQSAGEQNRRMGIEDAADRLGLPYSDDISTDRLVGMVKRIERIQALPKNKGGLLKPDRVLRNARETVARIERKRAQLEAENALFADLNDRTQDAVMDVFMDEDGIATSFMRTVDVQTAEQWLRDNPTWTNENGTDTRANQDPGQAGTPDAQGARASAGGNQADDPVAQQGSGQEQGAGQEGLTAPSRADVLAQKERAEVAEKDKAKSDKDAEAKARAERIAKEIAARQDASADNFQLGQSADDSLAGQGSIFDMPAESKTTSTYINGDRAEYTGKTETIHGGLFYEVKYTEGTKSGTTAVTQRAPDGTNPGQRRPEASSGIVTPQIVPVKPASEMSASELLRAAADKMDAEKAPKAAPIQDAGEKIGGARKDKWKERGLDLNDLDGMSESEGAEMATKANVWKPDYEAMAEATEPVTAAMVKTVYDQLAAQPKKNTPEGRRNYVTMMHVVRKAYLEAKSPGDVKNAGQKIKTEIGLYSTDPATKARAREVLFSVYKGRSDPFVLSYNELSKAKKMVEDGFPAKGEPWKKRLSIRAYGGKGITPRGIELTLSESAELGTPLTTDQIASGFFRISNKDGKAVGYAPTKEDAEATAKTIYERDLKKGASDKPEPVRPNLDELKRENLPGRIDRDVTADDFVNDLGFRGVEFGNWAAQDERQRIINMAYDGLMDLAEIMGVPPKAMSLNGTMGMAFGARGGGKFAAHYEPGKLVINMTKINGGGSMAHEWAHALDHYFGELNQKDAYTTKARGASGWYDEQQYKGVPQTRMEKDAAGKWVNVTKMRLSNMRPEMAKAFDGVMSALFSGQETKAQMVRSEELSIERYQALADKEADADTKAMYLRGIASRKLALEELRQDPDDKTYPKGRSAYAGQAQKLVGKSATGYWTRPTEMFARAFESWVFDKVAAMGARSDYLVHGVEEDRFAGGNYKGNPYPTGPERATINAAFDKLAGTIETKETEHGMAMFSRADSIDVSDPRTGISAVLLELGKLNSLYQYPRSSKSSPEGIAADKGMAISDVDRNAEDGKLWMIANTTPADAPGVKSWIVTLPGGKHATLTDKNGEVYINVASVGEGQGGSRVYDLAANYAFNNGLKFIGDPNGVSPAAMRRRLENMLSAAIKYGSTDFLAPHADQVEGRPDIGVPALRWTEGDTLGNIRSMVGASVAATERSNPIGASLEYDPISNSFKDGSGEAVSGIEAFRAYANFDERGKGAGQAGRSTLQRNALFNSLLSGEDARRAILESVHREQGGGSTGLGESTRDTFYSQHGAVRNPSIVERVQSAVAELIGTKQLPNQLGRVVATTAAEIKSHWEALIDKSVNIGSEGDAGVAQAFYDPRTKTVFLIADHISQGNETAVLAHELMHKHGQPVLGKEGWARLHGVISSWEHAPADSEEHAVYTYARNKVAAVGDHLSSQELFPYAVEAALKMGIQPSMSAKKGTVAYWLESVRQNMRMVWGKITGKPESFRTQDLVDLAFGIAQRENPEHASISLEAGGESTAPDSGGARLTQTDTTAFKAWFGDSKAVDKDGKPLVMYHGTSASQDGEAFTSFDTYASNYGLMGMGGYFTADPVVASSYTSKGRGDSPTVYQTFLSIKNPIDMEARADTTAWKKQFDGIEQYHEGGDTNEAWYRAAEESLADQEIPKYEGAEIMQDGLRAMGFDGITHIGGGRVDKDSARHRVYVAFDPEQIKSATGNNGNFDGTNPDIRFSRTAVDGERVGNDASAKPRASAWRDGTNRLQFAPGAWLYDKLGNMAHPLLVKLQMSQASPGLKRQIRQMKLDVQKAQDTAVAVANEANKLSTAERRMVSDIIEKELASGIVPPSHAVRLAATMSTAMTRQSEELVRLGMLSQEAAQRWDGAYLPRFYESKLTGKVKDAWADAMSMLRSRPRAMQGIKGRSLKGRGLYETVPTADLQQYQTMGWEVRDPDFDARRDSEVQVWRDYTRAERDKMGEIRDAGFRFVMGYMQTQKDVAMGRMFEGMASTIASRLDKKGYVRVPDTKVQGTGASRYGRLAGLYVPLEVMTHLSQVEESANESLQMYRKAMSLWKEGKTVLNPVSHVNNIVSNLSMAHFGGVSYHRGDKYLAAMKDFATKAPALLEAREAGLFLGSMSEVELMNTLPPELQALAKQADSTAARGAKWVYNAMNYFLRRPMGAAYSAEDTFFRYLLYKDARGRGMSANDAVDYAQRYIFTYDDLPKGARMIRDFGIPFFAYTYKAVPALLHTALSYPHRFAAPAAVLWAANAAAYAIAAGSDDDDSWMESLQKYLTDEAFRNKARENEKLEREHIPPWMKGTTALLSPKAIRLGMDELTKLPLFLDVSRIVPGGDIFDVSPNAGGLPIPQPITPSHPLFTTAVAMIGNKDLFFGKEITDSNDTRGEATEKRAKWMWQQIMPAIAAGNYHWDRVMNAIAQASGGEITWLPESVSEKYTGVGRDGLPVQPKLAAAQTFGIKMRPIDLETSADISESQQKAMLRQIETEMRSLKRLNDMGAISDRVYDKARDLADVKEDRIKDGLTVDGDEKP